MIITPFDVTIVMFLSMLIGVLSCEAYHLMEIYDDEQHGSSFPLPSLLFFPLPLACFIGGFMRLRPFKQDKNVRNSFIFFLQSSFEYDTFIVWGGNGSRLFYGGLL